MNVESNIYVVLARAELPTTSKKRISFGSKMLCKAQMKAHVTMFPAKFAKQLERLKRGDRVVILQSGYVQYRKKYGSVRFVAAGTVSEQVRKMTMQDVIKNIELWITNKKWYKDWPDVEELSDQLIIKFNLKNPKTPFSPLIKPKRLIVNQKTVLVELKPGSKVYEETSTWWEKVTGQWNYSTPGASEEKKKTLKAISKIQMLIKKS